MKKAYIYFHGDPSVGIQSYWYEMQVPLHALDEECREETRKWIKDLYIQLEGEHGCEVSFEDERLLDR